MIERAGLILSSSRKVILSLVCAIPAILIRPLISFFAFVLPAHSIRVVLSPIDTFLPCLETGLKKINTEKRINLTEEDFAILVENGRMCFEDRTINLSQWDRIMRKQMKMHVQRDLTDVMALYDDVIEVRHPLASRDLNLLHTSANDFQSCYLLFSRTTEGL